MQSWVQHVKSYCASKGISYKNALRDPQCKESYHSSKSTSTPQETPSNPEPKKRTSRIKIPVVEETIDVAHDSIMDGNSMGKNKKNPLIKWIQLATQHRTNLRKIWTIYPILPKIGHREEIIKNYQPWVSFNASPHHYSILVTSLPAAHNSLIQQFF
jgi:hypothetical protein